MVNNLQICKLANGKYVIARTTGRWIFKKTVFLCYAQHYNYQHSYDPWVFVTSKDVWYDDDRTQFNSYENAMHILSLYTKYLFDEQAKKDEAKKAYNDARTIVEML